jgi:hypothetical protein
VTLRPLRAGGDAGGRDVCVVGPTRDEGTAAMSRPTIQAIIEDGPRAGEVVQLDITSEGNPPEQFMLADEHLGARPADRPVRPPSGRVSTCRLAGRDEERGGYVYQLVPPE